MIKSCLIRIIPAALALFACQLSTASATPIASVYTWTASNPGLFLPTTQYQTETALDNAQGSNAGLYVPSSPTYIAGYNMTYSDMVIQCPNATVAAAAYANLYDMLAAGYDGGGWDGTPVTVLGQTVQTGIYGNSGSPSVHSPATDFGLTGIGLDINDGLGNDPSFTSFDGIAVNANSVLLKYTYNGDTGLNGTVQSGDLINAIGGYFNEQGAVTPGNTGWSNGETGYEGGVQTGDLIADIGSYGYIQSGGTQFIGSSDAQVAGGNASPVGVPEPATALMALIAIIGLGAVWAMRGQRAASIS